MKMKSVSKVFYFAIIALMIVSVVFGGVVLSPSKALAATFNGPLKTSTTNGRYFTDNSGKAIYLTGSHTWNNFQDGGWGSILSNNGTFDYAGYLTWMQ